ncbi:MAG: methyltransferase domain-containing protein [Elusimicrobiota bacterium]|jgi:phospholipid N-methyltransferase
MKKSADAAKGIAIRIKDFMKERKVFRYDSDSPFSYVAAMFQDKGVAAVTPSSKYLVSRVIRALEPVHARVVVEYGPAEGVMTRRILDRMPKDGRLIAVELNEQFAQALSRSVRDERLIVLHGDASRVEAILAEQGVGEADAIISGIPFSFFSPEERRSLVAKTRTALRHGGRFIAYQCTTHLIPVLKQHFHKVHTELELRNLPPHFVFTAVK